jgi:hypothetical protein
MSDPISDQGPETFQPPPPPSSPPPPSVQPEPKAPRPVKLRPVAIGLFVVGLILVGVGVAGILPGGTLTGAAFAFWGVLLFAFSFIPLPKLTGAEEPPMSAQEKLTGIFFEPTRVFKNLRAHPRWLAPFLVITVVTVVYSVAFVQRLTPERIVTYTMEKMEQAPIKPPADQMEQIKEDNLQQAKQPIQRVQSAAKAFAGVFTIYCFITALCLLGVLVFGGRINFWQAFAAILYAALPVAVIQKLLSLVILYIKDPDDIHPILNQESLVQDNLGFFFAPADHPVLFVLGSSIGILSFYGLWLRAKGLANAGHKVSPTAAWGTAILIWVLGLVLGLVFALLFPSFMS